MSSARRPSRLQSYPDCWTLMLRAATHSPPSLLLCPPFSATSVHTGQSRQMTSTSNPFSVQLTSDAHEAHLFQHHYSVSPTFSVNKQLLNREEHVTTCYSTYSVTSGFFHFARFLRHYLPFLKAFLCKICTLTIQVVWRDILHEEISSGITHTFRYISS